MGKRCELHQLIHRKLVEVKLTPQLNDQARFGLVTLAKKVETLYLIEIRLLMRENINQQHFDTFKV